MMKCLDRRMMTLLMLLAAVFFFMGVGCVSAAEGVDDDFSALITKFQKDGVIPEKKGTFISFNDFEDTYNVMGYYKTVPLLESSHFVLSVDLSWNSAFQLPNSTTSGCGVIFNSAAESTDIVMASLLMDGSVYLYGTKNGGPLYYGKYFYTFPSIVGAVNLVLVVDGDNANIFIDGERFVQKSGLPIWGKTVGFVVLAGTFQDYGTQCMYDNIHFFTWN